MPHVHWRLNSGFLCSFQHHSRIVLLISLHQNQMLYLYMKNIYNDAWVDHAVIRRPHTLARAPRMDALFGFSTHCSRRFSPRDCNVLIWVSFLPANPLFSVTNRDFIASFVPWPLSAAIKHDRYGHTQSPFFLLIQYFYIYVCEFNRRLFSDIRDKCPEILWYARGMSITKSDTRVTQRQGDVSLNLNRYSYSG